jgi:hypothetical protein
MIDQIVTTLFFILMGIPFLSAVSTLYLARLVKGAISPPILLVLLTIEATLSLLCSSYITVLTVRTRFFGLTNPPELLPITLLALITPLAMINVIALVLWRSRNGHTK